MTDLLRHPLFAAGLMIRLLMIAFFEPTAVAQWFAPFLEFNAAHLSLDPWSAWLLHGGSPAAFPYGYAMWVFFAPFAICGHLFNCPPQFAYAVALLVADVLLLGVIHRLLPGKDRLVLALYWLSPITILATYGYGLNDLFPALLLTLSIYCTRQQLFRWAGAFCGAAISAKLSMVLALPFFLVYLYNNRALRQHLHQYLRGLAIAFFIFILPFVLSAGGMAMLIGNPEMNKVYQLTVSLGGSGVIYLVPLAYLLMLYYAWRVRRLNFELFQSAMGLAFLMIVLLTPSSPGWLIWFLPFLVLYQANNGRVGVALASVFSGLYVLSTLLQTPLRASMAQEWDARTFIQLSDPAAAHISALLMTAMTAVGVILAIRIWRQAISRNDYFRLSRKPFVVGIAGDSGAGKDTYADSLQGLFGQHSVTHLSGDDYHLWDRQKPMWQVMTHLNPMANDLEGFCNDLIALTDGQTIQSRHYDHQTGKKSRPHSIDSNDFIIASGLHALYLPILRECYTLKVYLDIDEALRKHFKFQRDVLQRGHSIDRVQQSLYRRAPDAERFIHPQRQYADLVLSLQPINPGALDAMRQDQALRLKLVARTRHGLNEPSLARVLVGVCGLHVDMEVSDDNSEVILTIEGECSDQDIALAAQILCPRVFEFLDTQPQWQGGVLGLMQLITLSHINQALTKRIF